LLEKRLHERGIQKGCLLLLQRSTGWGHALEEKFPMSTRLVIATGDILERECHRVTGPVSISSGSEETLLLGLETKKKKKKKTS